MRRLVGVLGIGGLLVVAASALSVGLPPPRGRWDALVMPLVGTRWEAILRPGRAGSAHSPSTAGEAQGAHSPSMADRIAVNDATTTAEPLLPEHSDPTPEPTAEPAPTFSPITHLRVGRIKLDADVVEAPLVQLSAGVTWQVPAFKIGHGENTADAGEPGNAVLLGHVTSTNAGNVFKDLRLMRSGDLVEVFGGSDQFDYVVSDVRSVPRTDVSVLQPTATPVVTLITCSGVWLPAIGDYTERLIVRADLSPRG